ncbi:MAG: IS481 family transposase [Bacteroidota bacterium]
MSKNALIVLTVIEKNLSVAETAKQFGVTRSWVYELLRRHELLGLQGLAPASKRPHTNALAISQETHGQIAWHRKTLLAAGLDAGAQTIQYVLQQETGNAPSVATIWRSLKNQGLVEANPKKKPKAYLVRFEANQPNETWQSDFTHVRLANGKDIEVLNFLDDHSRLLLSCTAHYRVTGNLVVERFMEAVTEYGAPQSTLTDNGLVYTNRFVGGKSPIEYLLAQMGIEQKNSRPNHPQTQGKIERFHQTLKKWLLAKPKAKTLPELQAQLDEFRKIYNEQRPHKALQGRTPHHAYLSRVKAKPTKDSIMGPNRTRNDRVDATGKVSLRRAGKHHRLGIGRTHYGKEVFLVIDSRQVIVTDKRTGEILSEHKIEPTKNYWPKRKDPS